MREDSGDFRLVFQFRPGRHSEPSGESGGACGSFIRGRRDGRSRLPLLCIGPSANSQGLTELASDTVDRVGPSAPHGIAETPHLEHLSLSCYWFATIFDVDPDKWPTFSELKTLRFEVRHETFPLLGLFTTDAPALQHLHLDWEDLLELPSTTDLEAFRSSTSVTSVVNSCFFTSNPAMNSIYTGDHGTFTKLQTVGVRLFAVSLQ